MGDGRAGRGGGDCILLGRNNSLAYTHSRNQEARKLSAPISKVGYSSYSHMHGLFSICVLGDKHFAEIKYCHAVALFAVCCGSTRGYIRGTIGGRGEGTLADSAKIGCVVTSRMDQHNGPILNMPIYMSGACSSMGK